MSTAARAHRRLPLPPADADWWATAQLVRGTCGSCGRRFADPRPAVMAYRADLDHGGAAELQHPGWRDRGWLLWLEHGDCPPNLATVDATWVLTLGLRSPWRRLR